MKHFSSFIQPGARFVEQNGDKNCLAFLNPDNHIIIIYYNETEREISKSFKVGEDFFSISFPAKSLHTFVLKN
jgi:O-glycosyl hydrolase